MNISADYYKITEWSIVAKIVLTDDDMYGPCIYHRLDRDDVVKKERKTKRKAPKSD